MNEDFCYWSFTTWKTVPTELDFRIRENPNNPAEGSRVYTNPWVIQDRFEDRVCLFDSQCDPLASPPTNMVLVAEKQVS